MSTVNPSTAGTLSPSASNANATTIAAATPTTTSTAAASSTNPTVALLFQLNHLFERNGLNEYERDSKSNSRTLFAR